MKIETLHAALLINRCLLPITLHYITCSGNDAICNTNNKHVCKTGSGNCSENEVHTECRSYALGAFEHRVNHTRVGAEILGWDESARLHAIVSTFNWYLRIYMYNTWTRSPNAMIELFPPWAEFTTDEKYVVVLLYTYGYASVI